MRIVQVISQENDTEELSATMTPGLAKYSLRDRQTLCIFSWAPRNFGTYRREI